MTNKWKYVFVNVFYTIEAIALMASLLTYQIFPSGITISTGTKDDLVKWAFFVPFSALVFYGNKAREFVLVLSNYEFEGKWKFFYKYNINLFFLLLYFGFGLMVYIRTWFNSFTLKDFLFLIFLVLMTFYNVVILWHADIKLKDIEKGRLEKLPKQP